MLQLILYTILFDLATGFSIALTGDRTLISGNLVNRFWQILLNWKFILAMVLAVGSRLLFMLINNQMLKMPALAKNSTTLSVFITASSYIFIILLNFFLLNERITSQPVTFWRRKIVVEVGFFDESLHYSMDYDYWLRVGKKFKINVVNDYLASFRIHSASKAGASANKAIDADFGILKCHTNNSLLIFLHKIHNALIVFAYRNLIAGKSGLYSKDKT
jgi:hypothetical protein